MKTEIRDYFIKTFNHLVETGDVAKTEARSERYEMMLSHYLDVAEDSECGCFDSPEDLIAEIKKSEVVIKDFILTGDLTVSAR